MIWLIVFCMYFLIMNMKLTFCFAYYITQSGEHFTEKGIAFKINQLPKLVKIVDELLYDRIVTLNVELWTFCHRMLFISFCKLL